MKESITADIERMVMESGIANTMDTINDSFQFNISNDLSHYKMELMAAVRTAIRLEPMYAAACEYRVFKGLGNV